MKILQRFKPKLTRSTDRDHATDQDRLSTLTKQIDEIIGEITFERDGISKRYLQISEDAGFLLEAAEADPNDDGKNKKVAEFEKNLMMFKFRIRTLNMQMIELKQLKDALVYKFSKIDIENSDIV